MDEKIKQQQADWQRLGTKLPVNHFLFLWYLLVWPPESLKPTRGQCVARRRKNTRRLKGRERILLTLRKCAEIPPFLFFSPFLTCQSPKISLVGDGIDSGSNGSQQEPRIVIKKNFPLWSEECPTAISHMNVIMEHIYTQSPAWIRSTFLRTWGKPLGRVTGNVWQGDRKSQISGRMSKKRNPREPGDSGGTREGKDWKINLIKFLTISWAHLWAKYPWI